MPSQKITPKEKERLERYLRNVERLSYKESRTDVETFIMIHQLRAILRFFGIQDLDRLIEVRAMKIIRDIWPFKERRLRKSING